MQQHFYKPNSKNTGSACSFGYKEDRREFYCQLIKQHSWSGDRGSFAQNRSNPLANVFVKLSPTEAAGFIDAILRNAEFKNYHSKSESQNIQMMFRPYLRGPEGSQVQVGFSLGVIKSLKADNTKANFIIGFTFPEMELLRQFLTACLNHYFSTSYKETLETPPAKTNNKTEDEESTSAIDQVMSDSPTVNTQTRTSSPNDGDEFWTD